MKKLASLFILLLIFQFNLLGASNSTGVHQWKTLNTYNQVVDMDYYGQRFFCATESGFFIYHKDESHIEPFSKVNGMNDINMSAIAYDPQTETAVLAYTNQNIDLWNGYRFVNVSDIRLANITGDKTINHIHAEKGKAYISTGFGLVVLDIQGRKIDKTIHFYHNQSLVPVNQSMIKGNVVYIANEHGVFSSLLQNSMIENGATWNEIHSQPSQNITLYQQDIYFSSADSIFKVTNHQQADFIYKAPHPIDLLNGSSEALWVAGGTDLNTRFTYKVNENAAILDSIYTISPSQVISLADGTTWYADYSDYRNTTVYGFRKSNGYQQTDLLTPSGPGVQEAFDIDAYNGRVYIAHGGFEEHNYNRVHNRRNFSTYTNDNWHHYNWLSSENYIEDFVRIIADPFSEKFYVGSFACGVLAFENKNDFDILDGDFLPSYADLHPEVKVGGLAFDKDHNLWISTSYSSNELSVLKPNGDIVAMKSVHNNTAGGLPHSALDVIVDDYNQKWFITTSNNAGVVVYSDNETLENTQDDQYRILKSGQGNGNLPSGNTKSIAKDISGSIWIGTDNGIGIVHCPQQVITGNCEATLKKVTNKDDGFVGHIFESQVVNAIAVDHANRKWIGTPNGAWLISPEGDDELLHFNKDNSPLPENYIRRIKIDPITGEVYFVTSGGIAVYKGDAIQPTKHFEEDLHIYPNPVPANYQGTIVIDQLMERSDVRITDINSNLVYKTTSNGGRAVWDGYDYTGAKAQSGLYIVYVISRDGSLTHTGRFIIHR